MHGGGGGIGGACPPGAVCYTPATMWVQVRYFAAVREIIGDTAAHWELPEGATVGDLWGRLAAANPPLRQLACTAAVNQEYVSPETALADGDEVVFVPPVSGGAPGPRTA